jgi:metacaspase-1
MFYVIGIFIAAAVIIFIVMTMLKKKKSDKPEVSISVTTNTTTRPPIKKAFLVGINQYEPSLNANLRGCVNDVNDMKAVLTGLYGFDPANINLIIDSAATRANIISGLKKLLNDTKSGDELVFHYSGHGSQVPDTSGDEVDDHLDEIICPHDLDWNDPLTDDILSAILLKVPKGVNMTVISDSCHSGTVTRELGNPIKIKPRYLEPPRELMQKVPTDKALPVNKMGAHRNKKDVQRHVLLSGCKDNQTSADAYINGRYNGALTWALVSTLKANPYTTYTTEHKTILSKLSVSGYNQEPQMSGDGKLLNRVIFGGK